MSCRCIPSANEGLIRLEQATTKATVVMQRQMRMLKARGKTSVRDLS